MADIYGAAPTFTQGQVLSASAHLNALQTYVQALRDDFAGVAMPFSAETATRVARFAIRHKYDYFTYAYTSQWGGGLARVEINGLTVPGSESTGDASGSAIDISGLGLTPNEFYEVVVSKDYEGWLEGKLQVNLLCEVQGASGLTALPTFSDGLTPTASQWQALSTRAQALGTLISAPQPLGQRTWEEGARLGPHRSVQGTFNHRSRYLAYSFEALRSANRDDEGHRWTDCIVQINGANVLRCRVGNVNNGAQGAESYFYEDAGGKLWTGLLDLDTYPGALALGADYTWGFWSDYAGGGTVGGEELGGSNANVGLHYLYEVPDELVGTPGWTDFVAWAHGLYARGNSGSPQVQTLVANLNLLLTSTQYKNYASVMDRGVGPAYGLYGVRRWRWLHYRTDPRDDTDYDPVPPAGTREIKADPVLIYTYKGKEKRVSLSDAYQDWRWLDFDSAEGLVPGVPYKLENVKYAVEDIEA